MESRSKKYGKLRKLLMIGGPVVAAAIATFCYAFSGRFVSTDHAYIKGNMIHLIPEVSGRIVKVNVDENQEVRKGDPLFQIEADGYRIAVDLAEANLLQAYTQVNQLKTQYKKRAEDLARVEIDAAYTEKELDRFTTLRNKNAISEAKFNEVKRQNESAVKGVTSARQMLNDALHSLQEEIDISADEHALVKSARAQLKRCELDLSKTSVAAPFSGRVRAVPSTGTFARAGAPLMNLVEVSGYWIEANFKETELKNIAIGQPVSIKVDTFPGVVWNGVVESISPASESEFSVFPAQNSSGNWVKVVQRISVRISIEENEALHALRPGMSAHVTVDTGRYPKLPKSWN